MTRDTRPTGTTPRRRPRWFVAVFVGVQVLVPLSLLVLRLMVGGCRWGGWQMYACL